jgi:hypothetical protein
LALDGRTCQSSTLYGAFAARAADGNTNGFFMGGGSVTHTAGGSDDPMPWWQLSLVRPAPIGTVRVWARLPEVKVSEVGHLSLRAKKIK